MAHNAYPDLSSFVSSQEAFDNFVDPFEGDDLLNSDDYGYVLDLHSEQSDATRDMHQTIIPNDPQTNQNPTSQENLHEYMKQFRLDFSRKCSTKDADFLEKDFIGELIRIEEIKFEEKIKQAKIETETEIKARLTDDERRNITDEELRNLVEIFPFYFSLQDCLTAVRQYIYNTKKVMKLVESWLKLNTTLKPSDREKIAVAGTAAVIYPAHQDHLSSQDFKQQFKRACRAQHIPINQELFTVYQNMYLCRETLQATSKKPKKKWNELLLKSANIMIGSDRSVSGMKCDKSNKGFLGHCSRLAAAIIAGEGEHKVEVEEAAQTTSEERLISLDPLSEDVMFKPDSWLAKTLEETQRNKSSTSTSSSSSSSSSNDRGRYEDFKAVTGQQRRERTMQELITEVQSILEKVEESLGASISENESLSQEEIDIIYFAYAAQILGERLLPFSHPRHVSYPSCDSAVAVTGQRKRPREGATIEEEIRDIILDAPEHLREDCWRMGLCCLVKRDIPNKTYLLQCLAALRGEPLKRARKINKTQSDWWARSKYAESLIEVLMEHQVKSQRSSKKRRE